MSSGSSRRAKRRHWSGDLDAYVGELVVAPDHERRGVGRRLVNVVEQWASRRGLVRIRLETGAANEAARAFYERLGYTTEDVVLTRTL